jgi:hypothetical protein
MYTHWGVDRNRSLEPGGWHNPGMGGCADDGPSFQARGRGSGDRLFSIRTYAEFACLVAADLDPEGPRYNH